MDTVFDNFWNIIWLFFWSFAFIAYLFALFAIIGDLFRDRDLNGWGKAVWIIFLLFMPFLTALIYLIARGNGMAARSAGEARQARQAVDEHIRSVASSSPADEIAKAKALLDAGAITADEFVHLKSRALANEPSSGTSPAAPTSPAVLSPASASVV